MYTDGEKARMESIISCIEMAVEKEQRKGTYIWRGKQGKKMQNILANGARLVPGQQAK